MNRRKFLSIAGGAIVVAGGGLFMLSDKRSVVRGDMKEKGETNIELQDDEREILYLASLAPSGHNTQPWFIQYLEPYHWIIGNDKTKWLPAVDPTQRETILSIGAFVQNLELAASHFGYTSQFTMMATTNQDENIVEVRLKKSSSDSAYDVGKLRKRRTVRSGYLNDALKKEDAAYLLGDEKDSFHFIANGSQEHRWLAEQTIEANRIQAYRDDAQQELSEWIRFSNSEAEKFRDGLTTAGMEIEGFAGWVVRNFYKQNDVMSNDFREQGLDKVKEHVSHSAGWLVMTSKDNSVATLLETGKRMERLFLKVRERNIAIHPMTQILEEHKTQQMVNASIGISDTIQFILRVGYVKTYPDPVTLRRPIASLLRA